MKSRTFGVLKERRKLAKVLLVDDSDDLRSILIILLKFYRYETIEAVTGKEAVEKAISGTPDLILMDICLPDITGVDVAKTIKQNPITANIPIIAYTALPSRIWKQAALNAGIVKYLEKPISVEILKQTIEKFILS